MAVAQPNRLTFRPARAEDKSRVIEITAHTWGAEGDYIPQVWERWLADPQGELTVAEVDGVAVALAKLTWVGDGQWWMEGLRVHPDWRLRGIGQAMNAYQVTLAKRLGGHVMRYATGIRNDGSHRIAERASFHVLTRFVERVADKLDEPVARLETLNSADLDALWEMAQDSDLLRATNDVCVFAWKAFELTREWLAEHLKAGEIMGVRDATGCVAAWCLTDVDPEWDRLGVTTIDGTSEAMTALARSLRAHAAALAKVMVEAMVPVVPRALDVLSIAGYHVEVDPQQPDDTREHGVDILELRLDSRA